MGPCEKKGIFFFFDGEGRMQALFCFLNGILWHVTNRNEGGYCSRLPEEEAKETLSRYLCGAAERTSSILCAAAATFGNRYVT